MLNFRKKKEEKRQTEKITREESGQVFIANVWWPSRDEYERIVKSEFAKLNKNDSNYDKLVEVIRSQYSVRVKDLEKYLS